MDDINDAPTRPLGFWLRELDARLAEAFASAFAHEAVTRRDWRLLRLLVDGALPADLPAKKLRRLLERGWVDEVEGDWALTDAGRAAAERLGQTVSGIRSRVAGAVSPEDFATTIASLEAMAREFGWDETQPPAGRSGRAGGRHAFGPGFGHHRPGFDPSRGLGRPFGPRFGREHGPADERAHAACREREHAHRHGGRPHGGRRDAERAFERGYSAGFAEASRAPEPQGA